MATLEQALFEAQKNQRVCPQPKKWQELHELLPNKRRVGAGWDPALPLILAAWWDTPAPPNMLRLREHLEWASANGSLGVIYDFMSQLAEKDWHHLD